MMRYLMDGPLTYWIPVCTSGFAYHRGVERFGTATVAGADVGPKRDEFSGDVDVVRKRCCVQSGVILIDLRVAHGDEELVGACQASGSQQRCRREGCARDNMIARRDCEEQPGELVGVVHASYCGLATSRMTGNSRSVFSWYFPNCGAALVTCCHASSRSAPWSCSGVTATFRPGISM